MPATTTLARTLSGNIALSIARFGGFDDAVQIEFENLPANVVATAPPIAAGATNTTLTITPGLQALLGVNTFTIRATGQGVTPSVQSFQLTILEEPGFRLSFFAGAGNPSTPTLTASFKKINSPTFTAIITRIGGFDEPITISAIDVPAGMTVTVTPSVANAQTNSVTLQFSVLNSFNAGVYVLKLRGVASGGKTFDATMTMTVEL